MRIAFLGLGAMGLPMAHRLVAEHELTVWNRTRGRADVLAEAGASVARSPAEAASRNEIVVTMVRDGGALETIAGAADGLIRGLGDDAVWVDMSTVGPDALGELRRRLRGVDLIDAPVLGSVDEARAGRLRIFVGSTEDQFARLRPLFELLGAPLHVGPAGSGAAAKLVANSTLFTVLGALGEAIALGDALGLTREHVFDVLALTPLAAQAERRREALESGDYPPRFALSLADKDARLVVHAAARRGLDLRLASAAAVWLAAAERGGWGERDYSALAAWIIERAHPREYEPRGRGARYTVRLGLMNGDRVEWRAATQLGELKAAHMAASAQQLKDPETRIWSIEIVAVERDYTPDPAADLFSWDEVA